MLISHTEKIIISSDFKTQSLTKHLYWETFILLFENIAGVLQEPNFQNVRKGKYLKNSSKDCIIFNELFSFLEKDNVSQLRTLKRTKSKDDLLARSIFSTWTGIP